jgi:hypothetical protein
VRSPFFFFLFMSLIGCGSNATQSTAKSPTDDSSDPSSTYGPQLPDCSDGSCFACGDTVCFPGYHCEAIGNTSGCAWSASCANDATCECLAPELAKDPRCQCEKRDGHAFVICAE